MRVLVLDNYDSFTYNLVQYLGELGRGGATTVRNDRATVEELLERRLRALRGLARARARPTRRASRSRSSRRMPEAGVPTLGVCLGHQALAQAFGGRVDAATRPSTARRPRSSTTAARSSRACARR